MIVSVPLAFQVRSLQGLVKVETELARRTACWAQVKQLESEKLSSCSRGNLKDSNACTSTTLSWPLSTSKVLFAWNAKDRHCINSLTRDQWIFAKSTMTLALHFTLFSDRAKTAHFLLIFPGGLLTHQIDWQVTILLTDDRQDNYKRAEWGPQMFVYSPSAPLSLPFPRYFFTKQRACL